MRYHLFAHFLKVNPEWLWRVTAEMRVGYLENGLYIAYNIMHIWRLRTQGLQSQAHMTWIAWSHELFPAIMFLHSANQPLLNWRVLGLLCTAHHQGLVTVGVSCLGYPISSFIIKEVWPNSTPCICSVTLFTFYRRWWSVTPHRLSHTIFKFLTEHLKMLL